MKHLNGFYQVNEEAIGSRVYAMLRATELKTNLQWCFNDEQYDRAARSFKPEHINLAELYKPVLSPIVL